MTLKVVPSVHTEGARLVDYPEGGEPRAALTALARAHGDVYVVDVDGVRRNKPDLDFLREAARNLPVWLDAGSRYATDAMDVLVAGASRLTLRWNTLAGLGELEELADLGDPGTFLVAVEFTEKGYLANPKDRGASPEQVARHAADAGVGFVVAAWRFDAALARQFSGKNDDLWWYGPLSVDEAVELRRLGYSGVVVPAPLAAELQEKAAEGPTAEDDVT